jgi:hypothetical protein
VGVGHHETPGAAEGVAVDVGQGMGALVVYAPAELSGSEIELSPAGTPDRRVHSVFHRRQTGAGHVFAAVFPSVAAGNYELWGTTVGERTHAVVIRDGETTEARLTGG